MRRLAILFTVPALWFFAGETPPDALAKGPQMTLSGPDLPFTITIPFQHEARFWNAWDGEGILTVAEMQTDPTEPAYTLSGTYWLPNLVQKGLATWDDSESQDGVSFFYPEAGLVKATVSEKSNFLALRPYRQQLLRNYIDLGRAGLIPSEPSVLDYVAGLHALGRDVEITVDDWPVSIELRDELLNGGVGVEWTGKVVYELRDPALASELVELQLSLGERDWVKLQYFPSKGLLLDWTGWAGIAPTRPGEPYVSVISPAGDIAKALEAIHAVAVTSHEVGSSPEGAGDVSTTLRDNPSRPAVAETLLFIMAVGAGFLLILRATKRSHLTPQS